MVFEKNNANVLAELVDGKIRLSVGFTSGDEEFSEAAIFHCSEDNPEEAAELYSYFSISEVLDGIVELNELWKEEGKPLDIDAKPTLDALRSELSALIDRIDGLKYAS